MSSGVTKEVILCTMDRSASTFSVVLASPPTISIPLLNAHSIFLSTRPLMMSSFERKTL
jgi:hypothetical protein